MATAAAHTHTLTRTNTHTDIAAGASPPAQVRDNFLTPSHHWRWRRHDTICPRSAHIHIRSSRKYCLPWLLTEHKVLPSHGLQMPLLCSSCPKIGCAASGGSWSRRAQFARVHMDHKKKNAADFAAYRFSKKAKSALQILNRRAPPLGPTNSEERSASRKSSLWIADVRGPLCLGKIYVDVNEHTHTYI